GAANDPTIKGGRLIVEKDGIAVFAAIEKGGLLEVMDGGTATGVDKKAGGKLIVSTNALEVSGTNSKGQFSIKDGVSKNYEL
ncbi:AIDA repeat-containing protein, partial [Haemophilus parainfluenzae]